MALLSRFHLGRCINKPRLWWCFFYSNCNLTWISFPAATFPASYIWRSRIYLVDWVGHFWRWIPLFFLHLEEGKHESLLKLHKALHWERNRTQKDSILHLPFISSYMIILFWLKYVNYSIDLQGKKSSNDEGSHGKVEIPSICMYQDELEGEDYLFRTNIDDDSWKSQTSLCISLNL